MRKLTIWAIFFLALGAFGATPVMAQTEVYRWSGDTVSASGYRYFGQCEMEEFYFSVSKYAPKFKKFVASSEEYSMYFRVQVSNICTGRAGEKWEYISYSPMSASNFDFIDIGRNKTARVVKSFPAHSSTGFSGTLWIKADITWAEEPGASSNCSFSSTSVGPWGMYKYHNRGTTNSAKVIGTLAVTAGGRYDMLTWPDVSAWISSNSSGSIYHYGR